MLPYEKSRGLHQEKLNRFQAEARQDRLRSEAQRGQAGVVDRMVQAFGRGMVKVGEALIVRPPRDAH